jgi:hypothetical protein
MGGPITSTNQRTLHRGVPPGPDIAFLHALLNHHLPLPDDQLPITGEDAYKFGPRTEAKVKRFQEVNKINAGSHYGWVGPLTWPVLTKKQQVTVTVVPTPPNFTFSPEDLAEQYIRRHPGPQLKLTLPTFKYVPPTPPSGGLVLDSVLAQFGEQGTIPFDGSRVTGAHSLQICATVLNRANKPEFHHEFQFCAVYNENYLGKYGHGPGEDSKRDLGFLFSVNQANLPGMRGRWS